MGLTRRWSITATGKKISQLKWNIRLGHKAMTEPHVIDLALDLARLPALARSSGAPAIPANIAELMRIAAGFPEACEAAVARTGEPTRVVIEAARFYLQQVLFRSDADCYRILGIAPTASRATARNHMRWLLEWLHPDRNKNSWDAVYAERVLKAWREVSDGPVAKPSHSRARRQRKGHVNRVYVPWIEHSLERRSIAIRRQRLFMIWAVPTGLVIIFLTLWSVNLFNAALSP
jgi:hypothetical protein